VNRQLLTGALVAVAVAALVGWIANNTRWEEVTVPARLTGEAARNPFYTAERLTEELGATAEWRRTLGELPEPNAVLMLTSWHWDLIDGRRTRLEQWVESGGRLVILGNLSGGGDALQEWTGLAKEYPERNGGEADAAGTNDPESGVVVIGAGIPPCATLRIATGQSRANASREQYDVCGFGAGRLTSSRDPEWSAVERMKASDGARKHEDWLQAVRVAAGRGSVTWVNAAPSWAISIQLASPQPFGNRGLLQKDHGVLFVDALQLERDDHVVFLSEEESASLLELTWTYGSPVVLLALLLIALAVWRDTARFGPLAAPLESSRRSLAEQIRGTAQFARRIGGAEGLHAAMVRALHEAARLRIPGYERLRERDRIPAIAGLTGLDSDKLLDAMHSRGHRDAHVFRDSVALLDAARRNLVASRTADRRRRFRRRPEKRAAAEAFDPAEL
jgi:hypothetical protein